nr:MAG TPA: hypothetical protein [Bacteriophage sp.]
MKMLTSQKAIDFPTFFQRAFLFESLIPCQIKKTRNPLRLRVFLCVSMLFDILSFLRTQKIFYIHTSDFAHSEHKMLTKNANLFRTQRSGNT